MSSQEAVHNERIKLTANYLNGTAIAILAIGGFAPVVSYATNTRSDPVEIIATVSVGCLITSSFLHYIVRRSLGRMR
ncbi:MAG: amino acid transporter [Phyllobacteriaceae bacterium]|jgi:hypothetical protein|nr:amino acid transporter [Phyllobacteriaceae bacterium]